MSIINKGTAFSNGEQLTADKLNDLVDLATFDQSATDSASTTVNSSGQIVVADGGITSAKLSADAVETAKILDANVTFAKLADVIDDDTMDTASATKLATSESIKAYVNSITIGVNQTWQDMSSSRVASTSYQNTTGKPIMVAIKNASLGSGKVAAVSSDNSTFITIGSQGNTENSHFYFIVPNNHYYKYTGAFGIWCELR